MRLEQENCPPIQDPSHDDISAAIERIHPRNHSFLILSKGDDYVQAAGAPLRMTIEYRSHGDDAGHYRLGRHPATSEKISLNYSGGALTVNKNEVLSSEHCLAVFLEFFNKNTVPDSYCLRELNTETYT